MSTAKERSEWEAIQSSPLYAAIFEVVSEHDPEKFEAPGDEWLFRPDPDSANLSCEWLSRALVKRVQRLLGCPA